MAFDSFRDWVNTLDRAGELVRIQPPVAINTLGSHKRMTMSMGVILWMKLLSHSVC